MYVCAYCSTPSTMTHAHFVVPHSPVPTPPPPPTSRPGEQTLVWVVCSTHATPSPLPYWSAWNVHTSGAPWPTACRLANGPGHISSHNGSSCHISSGPSLVPTRCCAVGAVSYASFTPGCHYWSSPSHSASLPVSPLSIC